MNGFFRSFFAALLALFVFSAITTVLSIIFLIVVASGQKVTTGEKAVLVINLADHFQEIPPSDPLAQFSGGAENTPPSLSRLNWLIAHAKNDPSIHGIYLKAEANNNNFASSEELRNALINFRASGKFIYAYGNVISQRAYYVANVADRIYCNPAGGVEWKGLAIQMPFIKGTLQKLGVEPQIFYAGKFKSATEPLRETQMTEANRVQSLELLSNLNRRFLANVSRERKIDTAALQRYADSNTLHFASAALQLKMVDGLKYDDQVKDELRERLKLSKTGKINFVLPGKYAEAVDYMPSGDDKIALILAEGNIVDGNADRGTIGGQTYMHYIRKAREDASVKAIVIRVNSGGGSALASEVIWREVEAAKKSKPVIVSFGDVAASGGYYMSCGADSIFAQPNTITGSIGVFGVIPNMQKFFNEKLGVTFDEVSTSSNATIMSVTKPLTPLQRQYIQNEIDTIYKTFKTRVAEGRGKSIDYIDSIAQGRVWSGERALQLGLVDRLGGLNDAIAAAARKAKLKNYHLREYPGTQSLKEMIFGDRSQNIKEETLIKELGVDGYKTYSYIKSIRESVGKAQARMPFELIIE